MFGTCVRFLNSFKTTIMNDLNIEKPCTLLTAYSLLVDEIARGEYCGKYICAILERLTEV